jgi:c-di-GMP-binding flagellar brake protein YcgR
VEFVPPETYALRRTGEWTRQQRRADVRVSTHGLDFTVLRSAREGDPEKECLPVADLSAGGASVRAAGYFEVGEEVRCVFDLPGEQSFDLRARVVRRSESAGSSGRGRVAFQFLGVDHDHHAALLRWVYREQARRHREEKRRQGET